MNIPHVYTKSGCLHKLLKRTNTACLYRITKDEQTTYEVIKLRPEHFTNNYGALALPSSLMWGSDGRSFTDLTEAERHLKALSLNAKIH